MAGIIQNGGTPNQPNPPGTGTLPFDAAPILSRAAVNISKYDIFVDPDDASTWLVRQGSNGEVLWEYSTLQAAIDEAKSNLTPGRNFLERINVYTDGEAVTNLVIDEDYTDIAFYGLMDWDAGGFAIYIQANYCRVHGTATLDMSGNVSSGYGVVDEGVGNEISGLTIIDPWNECIQTHGAQQFTYRHLTLKGPGDDCFSILRKSHHGIIHTCVLSGAKDLSGGSGQFEIEDGSYAIQITNCLSVNNKSGTEDASSTGNCMSIITDPNSTGRTISSITDLGGGTYEAVGVAIGENGPGLLWHFTGFTNTNFNNLTVEETERIDINTFRFVATAGFGDDLGGGLAETTWGPCHDITVSNCTFGHTSEAEIVSIANGGMADAKINGVSVTSQSTIPGSGLPWPATGAGSGTRWPAYGITISDCIFTYITQAAIAYYNAGGKMINNTVAQTLTVTGGNGRAIQINEDINDVAVPGDPIIVNVSENDVYDSPIGVFFFNTDNHTFSGNTFYNVATPWSFAGTSDITTYIPYKAADFDVTNFNNIAAA